MLLVRVNLYFRVWHMLQVGCAANSILHLSSCYGCCCYIYHMSSLCADVSHLTHKTPFIWPTQCHNYFYPTSFSTPFLLLADDTSLPDILDQGRLAFCDASMRVLTCPAHWWLIASSSPTSSPLWSCLRAVSSAFRMSCGVSRVILADSLLRTLNKEMKKRCFCY